MNNEGQLFLNYDLRNRICLLTSDRWTIHLRHVGNWTRILTCQPERPNCWCVRDETTLEELSRPNCPMKWLQLFGESKPQNWWPFSFCPILFLTSFFLDGDKICLHGKWSQQTQKATLKFQPFIKCFYRKKSIFFYSLKLFFKYFF